MLNLDYSKLSGNLNQIVPLNERQVIDKGDYFEIDITDLAPDGSATIWIPYITRLLTNQTYNFSVEMKTETGTFTDIKIRPVYHNEKQSVSALFDTISNTATDTWTRYEKSTTLTLNAMQDSSIRAFQIYLPPTATRGKLHIRYNIKIEKGSSATPYQPNLLEDPFYQSSKLLGANIANSSVAFPIVTSDYKLYGAQIQNDWEAGQTYTVTLKGTKPSTQTFNGYLNSGTIGVGALTPVEGKTDVWQKTFTVTQAHIDGGVTNLLSVYQVPKETAGACKIEWVKLEKGDTATPNISMFQYFGEGLKESNNPTDYSWDITPEYAEKTMSDAVNVHDHQEVEGLKNFKDGIQVDGKNILPIEDTGWVDLVANSGYSWGKQAQVRKIGKFVMWRGALAGTTTLGDVTKLPSGFEPGGGYEMQFDLPRQSTDAAQKARIYVRIDGTVGLIASTSATSNIFLSGISYFVE